MKKNSPIQGSGLDEGVIAHFGSLTAEQKQVLADPENTYAVMPRGILEIAGSDAIEWLDSLTTQKLTNLAQGESAETLILSPQGRVEHQLKIVRNENGLYALVESSDSDATTQWLESMVFMKDVKITNISAGYNILGSLSEDGGVLAAEAVGIWHDKWSGIVEGGHQYGQTRDEEKEWAYSELIVPKKTEIPEEVGVDAFETLRIMAGRPRFGAETDEKTLPHELNWLKTAVHLDKGCYRGQETVAKVHNVGHPPRRLTLLHIDGSEHVLPERGAEILHNDKPVAKVTSSGFHHEAGPVALAVVKRNVPEDATLFLEDGTACSQEIIVPSSAGATVNIPRGEFLQSGARKPLL